MCNNGVVKCNKSKMCFFVMACKIFHPKDIFGHIEQENHSMSRQKNGPG